MLGAKEINPIKNREWGDSAGYISDMNGHVIAFAKTVNETATRSEKLDKV